MSDSYDDYILSTAQLEDMGYVARESELIKVLVGKAMDWFTSEEGKAWIIRYWESESPGGDSDDYEPGGGATNYDRRAAFLYFHLPEYLVENFFRGKTETLIAACVRACRLASARVYGSEIAQVDEEGGITVKTDVHEIFYRHALWVGSELIDESVFPDELENFLEETLRDW